MAKRVAKRCVARGARYIWLAQLRRMKKIEMKSERERVDLDRTMSTASRRVSAYNVDIPVIVRVHRPSSCPAAKLSACSFQYVDDNAHKYLACGGE